MSIRFIWFKGVFINSKGNSRTYLKGKTVNEELTIFKKIGLSIVAIDRIMKSKIFSVSAVVTFLGTRFSLDLGQNHASFLC